MNTKELAQALRHIAERLDGTVVCAMENVWREIRLASDELHALAEEIDPGSGDDLMAYVEEAPDDDATD